MKNIALITNILLLASTGLFAQGHNAQYNVKKGDTLTRIAKQHNTTVAKIKESNGLQNDNISIGQTLTISSCSASQSSSVASTKKSSSPSKHTTKKSETFYSIARLHQIPLSSLIAANPSIDPSKLRTGQVLIIDANAKPSVKNSPAPAKAQIVSEPKAKPTSSPKPIAKLASAPKPAPKPAPKATQKAPVKDTASNSTSKGSGSSIRTITVYEQMTYGQFAGKHGASTNQLNALNGLSLSNNTMLAEGSELYVPQY